MENIRKKMLLLGWLCMWTVFSWGQGLTLQEFNQQRLQRTKVSMMILGGWAVGNMAVGGVLAGQREGEDKYFHQMNLGWNVVNLSLATLGYISAVKADPSTFDLEATLSAHHGIQKTLLFNGGLDIGYMLGGLYLMERSKNTEKNPERLKGFGKSIILQGAFLFVFDLAAYFVHASHNKDLSPLLSGLYFNGEQLGLVLRF